MTRPKGERRQNPLHGRIGEKFEKNRRHIKYVYDREKDRVWTLHATKGWRSRCA